MSRVDHLQPVGVAREGVEQSVHLHAGQAEDGVDAVPQQGIDDGVAAGHAWHGMFPLSLPPILLPLILARPAVSAAPPTGQAPHVEIGYSNECLEFTAGRRQAKWRNAQVAWLAGSGSISSGFRILSRTAIFRLDPGRRGDGGADETRALLVRCLPAAVQPSDPARRGPGGARQYQRRTGRDRRRHGLRAARVPRLRPAGLAPGLPDR